MKIYKCDDYIISNDEKTETFFATWNHNFYKLNRTQFDEIFGKAELTFIRSIEDNFLYAVFMVFIILLTIVLYLKKGNYALINSNFIQATLVLVFNVFIHELGHILFLKIFYRESKIKIGFKFVFIYPAFFVDTSYSYLLPKYKRIAIYLAGNFTNCLFVLAILFLYPPHIIKCFLLKIQGFSTFHISVNKPQL